MVSVKDVLQKPVNGKSPRAQRYRKRVQVAFGPNVPPVHTGFTTNLSASGFGLVSSKVLPGRTRLHLTLTLPGGVRSTVQGIVQWAKQPSGGLGSMGLKLVTADEAFFRFLMEQQDAASAPGPITH